MNSLTIQSVRKSKSKYLLQKNWEILINKHAFYSKFHKKVKQWKKEKSNSRHRFFQEKVSWKKLKRGWGSYWHPLTSPNGWNTIRILRISDKWMIFVIGCFFLCDIIGYNIVKNYIKYLISSFNFHIKLYRRYCGLLWSI